MPIDMTKATDSLRSRVQRQLDSMVTPAPALPTYFLLTPDILPVLSIQVRRGIPRHVDIPCDRSWAISIIESAIALCEDDPVVFEEEKSNKKKQSQRPRLQ
jgi:hypothetical protein